MKTMKEVIELFKDVVIQIATPYSTGTGFYLKDENLIVTNDHVVRGNSEVVIDGESIKKQLTRVVYADAKYDLAFLEAPAGIEMPGVHLGGAIKMVEGDQVIAIGHPFGLKYTATQGIVSNTRHLQNDINYIQHDAALNPGNSGGPLINMSGDVVGINTFIIRDGQSIGFSLPVNYVEETIRDYQKGSGQIGARCISCSNLVFEKTIESGYCPHCGSKIELPSQAEKYEPSGVPRTIESIISQMGFDVRLSRRGPNAWEIQQGSARINISYYDRTGLVVGDSYLCNLPKDNIKPLYEFLLRENYVTEGLTFSVKGQDIILSLLIYDRYLNSETAIKLFTNLFEKSDYYDDVLVTEYGALWKSE